MPLPDEVRKYVELKRGYIDGSRPSSPNVSVKDSTNPHGPDYMRGYVGAGNRMSGEEADRRLMKLMKHW